jgi:mannose-1-phosphate guanylyltransferase/mannose-6-phosphate isomerase
MPQSLTDVYAVILAGDSGTRLWPLSRKNYPKQVLDLNGQESFLRQTVERLLGVVSEDDIVVITNSEYKFYVRSDLGEIDHTILEPESRSTSRHTVHGEVTPSLNKGRGIKSRPRCSSW